MPTHKLLIHGARQIVQVVNDGRRVQCGNDMRSVAVLQANDNVSGYSILVDRYVHILLLFSVIVWHIAMGPYRRVVSQDASSLTYTHYCD